MEKQIFQFLQQVCNREPGVVVPEGLVGETGDSISETLGEAVLEMDGIYIHTLLTYIWKGFYLELDFEDEELERLKTLLRIEDSNDTEEFTLIKSCASLSLSYALSRNLHYIAALEILEKLSDKKAFSKWTHWENHLEQKMNYLKCKCQPQMNLTLKRQMLWKLIYQAKAAYDNNGQWQASLWHEAQALPLLAESGAVADVKWLETSLRTQASYYQWHELDAYLTRLMAQKPPKRLEDLIEQSQHLLDEGLLNQEGYLELLGALKSLRQDGAVDEFIGLSKILSENLEKNGCYREANDVLHLWLALYL